MKNTTIAMVRQRFTVWVDLPAVSGDGWSTYPDYSAEETARRLRRILHSAGMHADLEHADTTPVVEPAEAEAIPDGTRTTKGGLVR